MPRNTEDFVATVLPRRVTFGQWLTSDGGVTYRASYFVNNHYIGVVERGFEGIGEPYAYVRVGDNRYYAENIAQLATLL